MQRLGVRLSVCLSQHDAVALLGSLLWAQWAGNINQLLHGRRAWGECGQDTLSAYVLAEHRPIQTV